MQHECLNSFPPNVCAFFHLCPAPGGRSVWSRCSSTSLLLYCYTVILLYCYTVILLYCYTAPLLYHNFTITVTTLSDYYNYHSWTILPVALACTYNAGLLFYKFLCLIIVLFVFCHFFLCINS